MSQPPTARPPARRILDRQVGRNAQLFAEAVGALGTAEARYERPETLRRLGVDLGLDG